MSMQRCIIRSQECVERDYVDVETDVDKNVVRGSPDALTGRRRQRLTTDAVFVDMVNT